ncbi:MAG: hypothetical protein HYV40_02275 [Candidatus Levybacteria bacterium]|nr:hypothetical protein [Candidatus Levybacteria bacterium]
MKYSWYSPSLKKDSPDAIHQVLAFGTLSEIRSLKNTLGETQLKKLFLDHPKKVYTQSTLHFITNFILHIDSVDEQKYLKTTQRSIRP